MADLLDAIDDKLAQWLQAQPVFFVATAPRSDHGLVNLSPKGLAGTFSVIDDHTVAYLDLTGGENETAAHLAQNERLTLMFCSFDEKPLIVRLYGKGRTIRPQDPEWMEMHSLFPTYPGERQIVVLHIESVMSTCGFAVPFFEYKGDRPKLNEWAQSMGVERLDEYRHARNENSIDGYPTYLFEDKPA